MPMLINTTLKESKGKGIGLFAVEFIQEGTVIYKDDASFDKVISMSEYLNLSKVAQLFIDTYASYSKKGDCYYLCIDNARFWNHSEMPNTTYFREKGIAIATQNILPNEELTTDYRDCCDLCKDGNFGFEIKN